MIISKEEMEKAQEKANKRGKEFFYIGHYMSNGDYILKVGTTNRLKERRQEHTRNYRRNKNYPMSNEDKFEYDFIIPLSVYNTLRVEDRTREQLKNSGYGEFLRNDRFKCEKKPEKIVVKVRKEYEVIL